MQEAETTPLDANKNPSNQHNHKSTFSNLFKIKLQSFQELFILWNQTSQNPFSQFSFLSSLDVAIRTIVDECCDIALVVVVTALFDEGLATPWRLVETSDQRDFLLEAPNHFFSAINPDGALQLNSTVRLRVFRDFQGVPIVECHCFAFDRSADSHQNHQSYCETKKPPQEHFRQMRESTGTSDEVMKNPDLKITFWLQQFNAR